MKFQFPHNGSLPAKALSYSHVKQQQGECHFFNVIYSKTFVVSTSIVSLSEVKKTLEDSCHLVFLFIGPEGESVKNANMISSDPWAVMSLMALIVKPHAIFDRVKS